MKITMFSVSIILSFLVTAYSQQMENETNYNTQEGADVQQQPLNTTKNMTQQTAQIGLPIPSPANCMEYIHKSTEPVCFIHPGFTFDAGLITSILSFNTITPVIAETEFDILHLGKVVFPKGTKIIGKSNLIKTLDRVNVEFNTIVYPNGRWFPFTGLALHTDGSGGVPGKAKKEKASAPARILLKTAGAATAIVTQQPIAGEMVSGIAEETEKEMAEKQTFSISVKKGKPILIYVVQEINF